MLRTTLLTLALLLCSTAAHAAPVEADMVCVDARDGVERRDRIVVVTGFSVLDAIVVVTGFRPTAEVACMLTLPGLGILPPMKLPVLCHPRTDGALSCRR